MLVQMPRRRVMADVNEVNDERQALEEKRMEELSAALEVMEALTKVWRGVGECGLIGHGWEVWLQGVKGMEELLAALEVMEVWTGAGKVWAQKGMLWQGVGEAHGGAIGNSGGNTCLASCGGTVGRGWGRV